MKRAVIAITEDCMLRCLHCYNHEKRSNIIADFFDNTFVEELLSAGINQVVLTGGEPTINWEHLISLLKLINKRLYIVITSNGILLNEKKIEELLRYGVQRLQISIDGATPNTHEYLRGNNTYHIIHNLIKAFPNFITPMYTIHAKNIDEIQPFIDQEKSLGVTKIGFERYIPTQNNPYNKELELTKEQLLFAYETISQNVGIDFHINDPLFNTFLLMKNNVTSDVVIKSFVDTGCQAYENNIYIDAKGNLYPCIFSEEPLFNVHNKKITTYKTFKPPIIKGCAGCIYYCICKGCRAAAAYYYKDWLERDPLCPIY